MAVGDSYLEKLDEILINLFSGWNIYTTLIATVLFFFFAYPWLTWVDPDTHPLLLARQASSSPVRNSGESAIYRSVEVPYGYPLRAGLNVKDPGAPKWSSGRIGDLRDIWRQAVKGPVKDDGSFSGERGKILTVLGREKVIEHDLDKITQDINVIGKYVQDSQGKCVAICLSNSVQLLTSIFAAAFYGFRPVIVPHGLPTNFLVAHLLKVNPDFLIAEAGTVETKSVVSECASLSHIIWVAKSGNRHMDWNEVPEGIGEKLEVVEWHDLIDERKASASTDVISFREQSSVVSPLSTFWPAADGKGQLVEYTSENLIAAVAALTSALPRSQRIGSGDTLLPIMPLSFSYPLSLTFAALFSNASLALNSVAGDNVDFAVSTVGVAPAVIVASSKTISDYHSKTAAANTGLLSTATRYFDNRKLEAGIMPPRKSAMALANNGSTLSNLRLLFVPHETNNAESPKLSSHVLSDLRLSLGCRICYALTTPQVAGAVCQTNAFDYRLTSGPSHFGPPLSSVEVNLVGEEDMVSQPEPQGMIVIKGPAVCSGETKLEVVGKIGNDNTISLV